jgi:hypothetical protein
MSAGLANVDMGEVGRQLLLKIMQATSSDGTFDDTQKRI